MASSTDTQCSVIYSAPEKTAGEDLSKVGLCLLTTKFSMSHSPPLNCDNAA